MQKWVIDLYFTAMKNELSRYSAKCFEKIHARFAFIAKFPYMVSGALTLASQAGMSRIMGNLLLFER